MTFEPCLSAWRKSKDALLNVFGVSAARQGASRTIEQAEVLRLSAKDQRLSAKTILNLLAPNAALRTMAKRLRELFGM